MKTLQSVERTTDSRQSSEQLSSGPATAQRKEYPGRTSFPLAPGHLMTGTSPIQRKSDPVIENAGVAQLTKDSAAKELFDGGIITVKKGNFKPAFNKKHGVTAADLDDIQGLLKGLIDKAPKKEKAKAVDMSKRANWHTEGGMNEGDAKVVAESLGWTEDTTQWTCKDRSHSPKGKVYTNGVSYYGADNTGHVGWGFKVWTVSRGKLLDYKGNISWDGTDWVHDARGTK